MSPGSQHELVSFLRPPVVEVVLGLQFQPHSIDLEAFGAFAAYVRETLPERQLQPVAQRLIERPGNGPLAGGGPDFQFEFPSPSPRVWFASADQRHLVQLQQDRLILNWRAIDDADEYPRYGTLRARLHELLGVLDEARAAYGATVPLAIDTVEVTYVNAIDSTDADIVGLPGVLGQLTPAYHGSFLPSVETMQLQSRWAMTDEHGRFRGRLYLDAGPGIQGGLDKPMYMVNLTSRVLTHESGAPGALEALDEGHRWAVLGFKDMTRAAMHDKWGLKG